jgi:hypothetical protein
VEAIISPLLEIGYVSDELRPCVCNNAGMKCPPDTSCTKCQADRICEAIKASIEKIPKETVFGENWDKGDGAERQWIACKSYMLEGLDGH